MSYKTIVVHLDTSGASHARLDTALRLARTFDAHVDGVFAMYTPPPASFQVMAGSATYYVEQEQQRAEHRGAIERLFRAELLRAKVEGEWIATEGYADVAVARRSRHADLIVAGQHNPDDPEAYVADHFQETLVLSAGRPVLILPFAGFFPSIGTRVVVAWDGSREAARAAFDALPFLRSAQQVSIVTATDPLLAQINDGVSATDLATAIARHGVAVDSVNLGAASRGEIGDLLLSQASDLNADLLVMGAYGHARWQELVMGGASRTVLKSMTLPVLMSH